MSGELAVNVAPMSFSDVERMANSVAKSGLFGCRTPESALTLMMLAQAEGKHPIQAMREYHIIENKPSMRADAMQAKYQQAGGRIHWLKRTDSEVSAEFSHPELQPTPIVVTWDDAKVAKAGLNRGNHQKFPMAMKSARVISEGVRAIMPGVVVGLYTPEEVEAFDPPPAPANATKKVTSTTVQRTDGSPASASNNEKIDEAINVENHPTNAPAKPAKTDPPKPKHPPIDLDDNTAVVDEWKRRLSLRGFTNEAAFMLLGAKLKEKSQSLDDLSKKGREAILWAIDEAKFDSFKDEFNKKAAGAGAKPEEKPSQKVEVKRKDEAADKPALTAEDFKDWGTFEGMFLLVAEQAGKDKDEASKSLEKALVLVGKKGKPEDTTKEWRLRLITAADDGAFDYQTGKINHVQQAIGA